MAGKELSTGQALQPSARHFLLKELDLVVTYLEASYIILTD
jgi:hypothetical protein